MSLECMEAALITLSDWPGIVAMFGGNPCLHSRFHEACRLWQKHISPSHRGLWTNNLRGHGPIVKDTFYPEGRFNLNIHEEAEAATEMRKWLPGIPIYGHFESWHGGILLDRKDYAVADAEWVKMREECDINRNWSGAVYERGGRPHAYFCEVAGAIDGVLGGNNGVPCEPGWWQRGMDQFAGQIRACCDAGCGVPLRAKGHQDCETTYDISPRWKDAVQKRAGKVSITQHADYPSTTYELTDYAQLRGKK
jgi:hypothetical protein